VKGMAGVNVGLKRKRKKTEQLLCIGIWELPNIVRHVWKRSLYRPTYSSRIDFTCLNFVSKIMDGNDAG